MTPPRRHILSLVVVALVVMLPGIAAAADGPAPTPIGSVLGLPLAGVAEHLLWAVGCLLASIGLLALEFFVISGGLLTLSAIAAAIAAIVFAFMAGPLIGFAFLILTPVVLLWLGMWGVERLRLSHAVPKAEVTATAGIHHRAYDLGIDIGSIGVLLNDSKPVATARFAGGEIDVAVIGASSDAGTRVQVQRIEGTGIFVTALPPG